jgi:two-component system sensor histidine kinase KdpD
LGERQGGGWEYPRAVIAIAVTTGVAVGARALLHVPDVEMLYLLGVMATALTGRRRASLLAAGLAVISYDFFFVPPPYTLDVADARYLLTFAMMFGVSVVIGGLTLRLREQRQAALVRQRRAEALYALSHELAAAGDEHEIAKVCARAAANALAADAAFLRARGREEPAVLASAPVKMELGPAERAAARWVLDHGRLAGQGAEVHADAPVLCAPIQAWGDVAAVLAVRAPVAAALDPDQRSLLEALGRQAALALDRLRLSDEARRAALRAEGEQLRSALLSAVSHDLRTPLAAITGAGTMLLEDPSIDPALRRDLVETICEEAERLERLVSNLLDMTRLDSGTVEPKREWVPLVEVIGGALTRLERRLAGRKVTTAIPEDVPLLSIDPVLVEQLFLNLLENAIKYTPAGTEIDIRAAREEGTLVVDVADRGPGIPPGDEERVFERFHRGEHSGVRGVGLGLPIARAIAQAHGGRLVAGDRPGGGAVFRLTLPLPAEPPPARAEAGGRAAA